MTDSGPVRLVNEIYTILSRQANNLCIKPWIPAGLCCPTTVMNWVDDLNWVDDSSIFSPWWGYYMKSPNHPWYLRLQLHVLCHVVFHYSTYAVFLPEQPPAASCRAWEWWCVCFPSWCCPVCSARQPSSRPHFTIGFAQRALKTTKGHEVCWAVPWYFVETVRLVSGFGIKVPAIFWRRFNILGDGDPFLNLTGYGDLDVSRR